MKPKVTLRNLNNLSSNEWAYIAGIVDGEGSIAIVASKSKKGTGLPSHYLRLYVGNTSENLIQYLHNRLGGYKGIYVDNSSPHPIYKYYLTGENAKRVLLKMKPYLIIKREQADLGIYFQDHKVNRPTYKGWTNKQIEEEISWRELIKEKISVRNGLNVQEKLDKVRDLHRLSDETSHLR